MASASTAKRPSVKRRMKSLCAVFGLVLVATATAKDVYWRGGGDGGTNSLSVAANWEGGKVPSYGSDTAVFDIGAGNTLSVTNTGPSSGNLWWGNISVLSGALTIWGGKSFYFLPTSKTATIHVAEGAALTNLNHLAGGGNGVTALVKTGKGRLVQHFQTGYSGASGNCTFTDIDIREGEFRAAPNASGRYGLSAHRVFIRSGAKLSTSTYSGVEKATGFFVEKGGVLSFGGGTAIDGISGEGEVIKTADASIKFKASRTNYVFTGTATGMTFSYESGTHAYTQSFGAGGKAATLNNMQFGNSSYDFDFSDTEAMDVRGTMTFAQKADSADVTSRLFGPGSVSTSKPVKFHDFSLTNSSSSSYMEFKSDTEIAGGNSANYRLQLQSGSRLLVTGGRHVGVPNKTAMNHYETMYKCARPDGIFFGTPNTPAPSVVVSNALLRIGSASGGSSLGSMAIGAGGVVEIMRVLAAPSGSTDMSLFMDGGTLRFDFAKNPYSLAWPVDDGSFKWTMKVGPCGARIEFVNPSSLHTYNYRVLDDYMPAVSDVAEGEKDGGIVFDVPGTLALRRPQAVNGPVSIVDGRMYLLAYAVTNAVDNAPLGTGDFTLSNAWLSPGRSQTVDVRPRLAVGSGSKMRYAGAATLSVYWEGTNPVGQTFTIGPDDAAEPSLVRAGAGASLYVRHEKNGAKLDGTDGGVVVKGGMAEFANGRVKDPVFALRHVSSDVYFLNFLTYDDDDGLVELPYGSMTYGLDGGADSVAYVAASNKVETVDADKTVSAMRIDGHDGRVPITISKDATLTVGNGTDVACVLLNQTTAYARSSIAGPGTLDFGTSEGLFAVASSMGARNYSGILSATIAGSKGVTFNGPIGLLEPWIEVSGANVYTGGTKINCLEVRASNAKAFADGLVEVGRGCGSGGQVKFTKAMTMENDFRISGNGAKHYGGTSSETDHGALWFAAAGVKLTGDVEIVRDARVTARGGANYEGVFEGVVSGGRLGLMRSTGRIVMANDNTYTGGTEVVCGSTLVLKKAGGAGTGEVHLDDSTLVFENDEAVVFTNDVSGLGEIRLAGAAPVTFTCGAVADRLPLTTLMPGSSFDFPGLTNATLRIGGDMDLGGGSYTVASVEGTGRISNGSLTVTDAIRPGGTNAIGTLTFSGVTFAAGTRVEIEALGYAADKVVFEGEEPVDLSVFSAAAIRLGRCKAPSVEVMSAAGGFVGAFEGTTVPSAAYEFEAGQSSVTLLHSLGMVLIVQ